MKVLLFLLLISQSAGALTLTKVMSLTEGSASLEVEVSNKTLVLNKSSNQFAESTSLSLGKFISNEPFDERSLIALKKKIDETHKFLSSRGLSFNELSAVKPHETFFMVDEAKIGQGSVLHKELDALFTELMKRKWTQREGIELSDDRRTLVSFQAGKATKGPFNLAFHCKQPSLPTVCYFKDLGWLKVGPK
jgi:hypothetical protein